jgi:plasmid maintenance system antidote protein VapI
MTFLEIVLRYQNYDPLTGRYDRARSNRDYASLLGVSDATISRLATRQVAFSLGVARGLARAFPTVRDELADAILSRDLAA